MNTFGVLQSGGGYVAKAYDLPTPPLLFVTNFVNPGLGHTEKPSQISWSGHGVPLRAIPRPATCVEGRTKLASLLSKVKIHRS